MTPSQTQVRTHTCTRSRNLPWLQSVCKQRRLVAQQQRHKLMGEVETQPSGSALHHCVSALIRGLPGWAVDPTVVVLLACCWRACHWCVRATKTGIKLELCWESVWNVTACPHLCVWTWSGCVWEYMQDCGNQVLTTITLKLSSGRPSLCVLWRAHVHAQDLPVKEQWV